jgi:hypothetical protein
VSTSVVGSAGPASATLAGRLAAARRGAFVGRASELDLFRAALTDEPAPFAVLFLHGPGGIGKSALVRRLGDEAVAEGHLVITLDGREAGSPASFVSALAVALGVPAGHDPVPTFPRDPPVVLLVDAFEATVGLDRWLREDLLPRLPDGTRVVLAGRDPPSPGWREDPGWNELLRVVALRNLAPDDARGLLSSRGLPPERHDQVLRLTGGHPLALALVADVVAQTGRVPAAHEQVPDVVAALADRFLADTPSRQHRDALHVCAHARHTTPALLEAALPGADAGALFRWLEELSCIERTPEGLAPHELVRDVLDADLRWRDDRTYRGLHARIREHAIARLYAATEEAERERRMWDLQYLHRRNPLFGPYVMWDAPNAVTARALRPEDLSEVTTLAEEFEGSGSAAVVAFWAAHRPTSFVVFERPDEPAISGFATLLELTTPTEEERHADPVVGAVCEQLVRLRPGERIHIGRHFVFRHAYGLPCPEFDLVQVRAGLRWLTDEQLAWSFVSVPATFAPFWEPQLHYLDMPRALPDEVAVGDRRWVLYGRDWRAGPADAWLELMGERELAFDLDPTALGRVRPPEVVVLSQPEFEDAVRRALRDVGTPRRLAANPLARSRLVRELPASGPDGDGRADGGADTVGALAELLVTAVDALREDERGDRLHRAVATTYFKGVPTQEAAASRLGMPFSTYRRHLAAGVAAVTAWLWERELHGAP